MELRAHFYICFLIEYILRPSLIFQGTLVSPYLWFHSAHFQLPPVNPGPEADDPLDELSEGQP